MTTFIVFVVVDVVAGGGGPYIQAIKLFMTIHGLLPHGFELGQLEIEQLVSVTLDIGTICWA